MVDLMVQLAGHISRDNCRCERIVSANHTCRNGSSIQTDRVSFHFQFIRLGWSGYVDLVGAQISTCSIDRHQSINHPISLARHPSLVLLMGIACYDTRVSLVSELMENGTLHDYVISHGFAPGFDWNHRLEFATQVARAMLYLHSLDPPVVHRNLSSLNVLVSETEIR